MNPPLGADAPVEETPVEAYWHAVEYVVEWANGRTATVEQPPLPLSSAA